MVSIERFEAEGFEQFRLSNAVVEAVVIPALGGKIASMRSLVTGREWMWRNPHLPYRPGVYGSNYVETYDTGGFDECFPTVGECVYTQQPWAGKSVPDHGELYAMAWDVVSVEQGEQEASVTLATQGTLSLYRFERRLSLVKDANRFRLAYEVTNPCEEPIPFIWAGHAIMQLEPGMRLRLPKGTRCWLDFCPDACLTLPTPVSWPYMRHAEQGDINVAEFPDPTAEDFKPYAGKFFSSAFEEGWAALETADDSEAFIYHFDPARIPHFGFWINCGKWSGAGTKPYYNLAFEPLIGDRETLEQAREAGRHREIAAGGSIDWELEIELQG